MTVYSHSRISTFEKCPLKFKLTYIDKAEPEFKTTIEAFMGSRVHEALEHLYNTLKFCKVLSLAELLDYYQKEWDKNWTDDVKIVRKDVTAENYREMGVKFLTNYYNRFQPFDQEQLISCEERILVKFGPDNKYQVQGYIDRLSTDNKGLYFIHDYKTGNSLPVQGDVDEDRQLALYSIAIRERYSDCKDVKLIWHYMAFDKDIESSRTVEELEDLKEQIASAIDTIESAKEFPAKESALCDWCEYRYICPNFKHLYKLEKQPGNPFLDDNSAVLVNKYVELREKEKNLKEEIKAVEEAIYDVSDKEGMSVLYGNHDLIRVWQKECVKLPPKTDPLFPEMVKLLKSTGKFDDVATVDTWAMAKIIENNEWPRDIINLLQGFIRREKVRRLYPKKRDH